MDYLTDIQKEALHRIYKYCEALNLDFMIVGAVARDLNLIEAQQPIGRSTSDVDIVVFCKQESIISFTNLLASDTEFLKSGNSDI
jgi:predicted nucleotidyltransferase